MATFSAVSYDIHVFIINYRLVKNAEPKLTHLDHIIGSPLALASASYAPKAWASFPSIPALACDNVRFIQGTASSLNPSSRTLAILPHSTSSTSSTPISIEYDFFMATSGIRRVWPVVPQSLTRGEYLAETSAHIARVSAPGAVVLIVGGGAVGVEMAAELKTVHAHNRVLLAHSRDSLLSSEGLSDECKALTLKLLRESGVEVLLNHRVKSTADTPQEDGRHLTKVIFENGDAMMVDQVVWAISKALPTSQYLPPAALDADGYVKISPRYNPPPVSSTHHPPCTHPNFQPSLQQRHRQCHITLLRRRPRALVGHQALRCRHPSWPLRRRQHTPSHASTPGPVPCACDAGVGS